MTKICARCKQEKSIEEFRNSKSHIDKKFHTCKKCMNLYYENSSQRYRDRDTTKRLNWKNFIGNIKLQSKCSMCDETHIATLDFHHVDSTNKDFTISTVRDKAYTEKNIKIVLEEIKKCVILCSNCHRKLHWNDFNAT